MALVLIKDAGQSALFRNLMCFCQRSFEVREHIQGKAGSEHEVGGHLPTCPARSVFGVLVHELQEFKIPLTDCHFLRNRLGYCRLKMDKTNLSVVLHAQGDLRLVT